ncbi:alpha/beta fold hydrolase [Phytohabitans kaempferiae]|uniref:Alpha/beta fold hydrolase n=1 Tax=Phytohabitans kaempferiae TaxID=1620943 RepID=A0ABV6M1W0_9ACTN
MEVGYWTEHGNGPALLLVHGGMCDHTIWDAQVDVLAETFRVITLDLPGHGRSHAMQARADFENYVAAVDSVRAAARADRVALVGHAMGATIVSLYARLHPLRAAALVGVEGDLDPRTMPQMNPGWNTGALDEAAREMIVRSKFTPDTPDDVRSKLLTVALATPEETAIAIRSAKMRERGRRYPQSDVPALAIYGASSKLPDEVLVRSSLSNYESRQIDGTGPFLMMERPDEFSDALSGFLIRVGYSAAGSD